MLDHIMRFNASAAEGKLSELARVPGAGVTPDDFVAWLSRLKLGLDIPARLADIGANRGHIARLSELAFNDSCHATNPRPCTREDFERIFTEAL